MESVAATLSVKLPLEGTASGVPVGPVTNVTPSGTGPTCAVHAPPALWPCPSLAVRVSVHTCWMPVALLGAVHVGPCALASGRKLPVPSPPPQRAFQA